jgi:hypothetical protein
MKNIILMETQENKMKTSSHNYLKEIFKLKTVQIGVTLLICGILFHFNLKRAENKKNIILKDGIIIKATLEDVYTSSTTTSILYSYYYLGEKYKDIVGGENCPYRIIKCKETKECVGDTILIKMSTSNPNYTMIVDY